MKYKPCCGVRCLVNGCKTKADGGCFCLCKLKDAENSCKSLLLGTSYRFKGGIIYEPGRTPVPLEGEEKQKVLDDLEKIKERIKTYEIKEEDE